MNKSVKTKFKDLSIENRVEILLLGQTTFLDAQNTFVFIFNMNKNVFLSIFFIVIIIKDFPPICQ